MKRRICSLILIFFLLAELWVPVSASGSMTTSADGKAFIKEMQAGQSYDLSKAEKQVNSFLSKYGLSLKQSQFDALVDLAVAYPGSNVLTSGYNIEKTVAGKNYTDASLASAFTAWVKDNDGSVSATKLTRRIREAKLFLYGSYDGNTDAKFRYVLFNPNGGDMVSSNLVVCYPTGQTYGSLPTASRSGKHFAGWYTTASSGDHIHNNLYVDSNRTVYAHWSDKSVSAPNDGPAGGTNVGGISLKVSENCVNFIKVTEGFSDKAYWDNSQWTIGYGTKWDSDKYPNGVTRSEADYLLRLELSKFESTVDKLLEKGTVKHTQNQYDAIISFTFNLGSQWMKSGYRIYQYILFGHPSEADFISAMGAWANSGGGLSDPHMRRRMDEANMYLNGSYDRFSTTYFCAHMYANGGTMDSNGKSEGAVYCRAGQPLGELPTASRSGYYLKGWFSAASGGTAYTSSTVTSKLSSNSTGVPKMYAQWSTTPVDNNTQPTEPEPTETTQPPTTEPPTTAPPTTAPPEPPNPVDSFWDVNEGDWCYSYVDKAVNMGLLNGMTITSFAPNQTMTRGMVVTVLYRLAGSPSVSGYKHPFTDVSAGRWYTDGILWAYNKGIVNGLSDTVFGKNEPVTRQQLVTMLYRYAQYCGIDVSTESSLDSYPDGKSVSSYAKPAFRWAVAMGIINGSDGKLLPYGPATRAQCAKIMVVFSELIN